MLDPKIEGELKKAFKSNVIIYIALIVSVFIYAGVVEFIKQSTPQTGQVINLSGSDANMFRNVLIVVAVFEYFLIRFIRSKVLSRKTLLTWMTTASRPFSPPVQQLITLSIMTYALCETVVVYGFILFYLSGVTIDFYLFMVISLVFFGLFRPQYSQWQEWMESRGQ
ncbi:MAG: hypothetical protein M1428_04660 [Deltaproteobacteria bacterium]|nr:hypothetical protein [Deltaproteobacteria bacterium]